MFRDLADLAGKQSSLCSILPTRTRPTDGTLVRCGVKDLDRAPVLNRVFAARSIRGRSGPNYNAVALPRAAKTWTNREIGRLTGVDEIMGS
jgi:hypothetical protein